MFSNLPDKVFEAETSTPIVGFMHQPMTHLGARSFTSWVPSKKALHNDKMRIGIKRYNTFNPGNGNTPLRKSEIYMAEPDKDNYLEITQDVYDRKVKYDKFKSFVRS